MASFGLAAPIQRWQAPKPGTRWRSGMCSRSYQSWNSSACASEKSNAAIRMPFGMVFSPSVDASGLLQKLQQQLRDLLGLLLLHPMPGAVEQVAAAHVRAGGFLHALDGAGGLVDAPVLASGDEQR